MTVMDWKGRTVYAVILYVDDDETVEEKDLRDKLNDDVQSGDSYWAFLTPEASESLYEYFEERKRYGENFDDNTPIFRNHITRANIHSPVQLSDTGVNKMIRRVITDVPELKRVKKGRRFDIQINHGFRKRTNTILKLESKVNSNIAEKIMGHKNGLDGVYFTPTRQDCFVEFIKAIPELTIDDSERKKIELEIKDKELEEEKSAKHQLEKKVDEINDLKEKMSDFENLKQDLKEELLDELRNQKQMPKKA